MEIKIIKDDKQTTVQIFGRVDTLTATDLESQLTPILDEDLHRLIVDCEHLEYISSAGFRLMVMVHKAMVAKSGQLILTHLNTNVYSLFAMTGLSKVMNIEE